MFDKEITKQHTFIMKITNTKVAKLAATLITFGSLTGGANGATILGVSASTNMGEFTSVSNIVDGSGLTGAQHLNGDPIDDFFSSMWQSSSGVATGDVTFDLGGTYSVGSTEVWNHNAFLQNSVMGLDILSSADGVVFTPVASFVLAQGSGLDTYTPESLDLGGVTASHVRFSITSNHGGQVTGLSEVQFSSIPEPSSALLFGLGAIALVARRRRIR